MKRKKKNQNSSRNKKSKIDLHEVIYNGSFEEVKSAVESGTDINSTDNKGNSVLHICAEIGCSSIADYLIRLPNSKIIRATNNSSGLFPIEIAIDRGHENFVALLIREGVNLNTPPKHIDYVTRAINNSQEFIAMIIASRYDKTKIARNKIINLAHNRKYNDLSNFLSLKNEYSKIGKKLEAAAKKANIHEFEKLLLKSKEIYNKLGNILPQSHENLEIYEKNTSFFLYDLLKTDGNEFEAMFDYLQSGKPIDTKNIFSIIGSNINIVHMGLIYPIIKILIKKGADIHAADDLGSNIFHYLTMQDKHLPLQQIVEHICIERGESLDLEVKDNQGRTPLFCGFYNGSVITTNFLLGIGADPHTTDNKGNTILHIAAEGAITPTIINKYNLDVNKTNNEGKTAIYCQFKNYCNLQAILSEGAELPEGEDWNNIKMFYNSPVKNKLLQQVEVIDNFFTRVSYEDTLQNIHKLFSTTEDFTFFITRFKALCHTKNDGLVITEGAPSFEDYLQLFISEKDNPLPVELVNQIDEIYSSYTSLKDNVEGIIVRERYNAIIDQNKDILPEAKEDQKLKAPISYKSLLELLQSDLESDDYSQLKDFFANNHHLQDFTTFISNDQNINNLPGIIAKLTVPDDIKNFKDFFTNFGDIYHHHELVEIGKDIIVWDVTI